MKSASKCQFVHSKKKGGGVTAQHSKYNENNYLYPSRQNRSSKRRIHFRTSIRWWTRWKPNGWRALYQRWWPVITLKAPRNKWWFLVNRIAALLVVVVVVITDTHSANWLWNLSHSTPTWTKEIMSMFHTTTCHAIPAWSMGVVIPLVDISYLRICPHDA